QAGQHQRRHQQGGRDRTEDEGARDVHRPPPPPGRPPRPLRPPGPRFGLIGRRGLVPSGMTSTFAPSVRSSTPSSTILSLAASPLVTATRSPSVGPRVMRRMVTVLSGLTPYTNVPNDARCTAAAGITVASVSVLTFRRMLTNWFGKSRSSALVN